MNLRIKDKYGNQLSLYQARSGQIYINFANGIPLSHVSIVNGNLETFLRDIEDFDEEKYNEFYRLK